jgi:Tol biopolymer transport system component/cell wall-associated NlpC family hydrolase
LSILVFNLILSIIVVLSFLQPGNVHADTPPPPASPVKITRTVSPDPAKNVSGWPSISADGSFIAFSSADNLTSDDTNAISDIYIYHNKSKSLELASLSSDGGMANGASYRPAIAASGRFIAFTSLSTNLDIKDSNGLPDIFLRDRTTGNTIRVSSPSDGSPANGWSDQASLSADGRYVLFISSATNLAAGVSIPARRFYLYDTRSKQLRLIPDSHGDASLASLSADGRYIVFAGTLADKPGLFIHDQISGSTQALPLKINSKDWSQLISQVEISADGSQVAILVNDKRSAAIVLYDRQLDQTTKIADIEPLPGTNTDPDIVAISADGRSLVYITGPTLMLYDQGSKKTRDIARFTNSTAGLGTPAQLALSPDGGVLAFQLKARNSSEIYSLDIAGPQGQTTFISGWLTNELGTPISGVEISAGAGHTTRTDAQGNFRFEKVVPGSYTINPVREGVTFSPTNRPVSATLAGISGLAFVASPDNIIAEARKDIGMPYSLNRGCESPFQECGGPFHGFYRGDCTDLVIDAYAAGVGFDISLALDQDFMSNPRHYYRWRDARNAHDMWRYYSYTNQILAADQPYLPGDIVFFDWEMDGEVDHVALVSVVNNKDRPRRILDATGVTADNPSGLAIEMDWRPYHAARTPGHARWTGLRGSQSNLSNKKIPVLLVALDSPDISLRLSDTRDRSISSTNLDIPGGSYLSTGIGKVISVDQPLMTSEWYFIELSSPVDSTYQLGIQLVTAGIVSDHYPQEGSISAGKPILIPVRLELIGDQIELKLP